SSVGSGETLRNSLDSEETLWDSEGQGASGTGEKTSEKPALVIPVAESKGGRTPAQAPGTQTETTEQPAVARNPVSGSGGSPIGQLFTADPASPVTSAGPVSPGSASSQPAGSGAGKGQAPALGGQQALSSNGTGPPVVSTGPVQPEPGRGQAVSPPSGMAGAGENGHTPAAGQSAAPVQPSAKTTGGPGQQGAVEGKGPVAGQTATATAGGQTPSGSGPPAAGENGRATGTVQSASAPPSTTAGGPAQPDPPKLETSGTGAAPSQARHPVEAAPQLPVPKADGQAPKTDLPPGPGTPRAEQSGPREENRLDADQPVVEKSGSVPASGHPAANQPGANDAARGRDAEGRGRSSTQEFLRGEGGQPPRTEPVPARASASGAESVAAQRGLRAPGEAPPVVGAPEHKPGGKAGEYRPRADSVVDAGDAPAAIVAAQLGSTTPDPGAKSLKDEASDGPVEGFVSVAEWGAVRDSVPQVRHRGERRG
ncbi:hypothetical protein, partial [Amycolatopsis japonica]